MQHSFHPFSANALRTVFLDRDGVINQKMPEGQYIRSWAEFQLLVGVPEAIARLNRGGLKVIVVSNQRGIALGLYSERDVRTIHANLQKLLARHNAHVDAFYFCPHDKGQCNCRKPLPGLFENALADFPDIAAKTSIMIGDSLSDIEFGLNLDMSTIFIESDPSRRKPGANKAARIATISLPTLPQAVDVILKVNK